MLWKFYSRSTVNCFLSSASLSGGLISIFTEVYDKVKWRPVSSFESRTYHIKFYKLPFVPKSNYFYLMSITSIPIDTRRKLNVHKTFRASSERLMYVQFTFCVYWDTKTRFESLTHFTPMFHFYTPCRFLTFSGIWKWNTCREMC